MINPLAQTFMIATRTERTPPPRLLPARDPAPKPRGRWPWSRRRQTEIDPTRL